MIVASEEMHDEKTQFQSLINELNSVLALRGVELERIKWDPDTDGSMDDYMEKLKECEMCLTLFWRNLAAASEAEFEATYRELEAGNNPHYIYIFFKEPAENLTEALKTFKNGIETKYGHFFCKFENVDTMNLQFILKFMATQNQLEDKQNPLVTISAGKVKVGDKELVSLDNVPFAALNKEYQRIKRELEELDGQIADAKEKHKAHPDDEDVEETYFSLRSKRKKLVEEFEKYQNHLYDIALSFARFDGKRYSERIRRAKEEFEKGNVIEADSILNMEEMKREAEQEKKQLEQHIENLRLKVEEFRMKADTVMANTELSIPDRFAEACEAFEQAIEIARIIQYDEDMLANMLFDYAYLLQLFNRMNKATDVYDEVLVISRHLASLNPEVYESAVATTLNNLAILQRTLGRYVEAEKHYTEALGIYRRLALSNSEVYEPYVAITLNNLAVLQYTLRRYAESEKNYTEALEIRRRLALSNQEAYASDVAMTLNNLANLQRTLGRYAEAEKNYTQALIIYRCSALSNPEAYVSDVAMALNNLAGLQNDLGRYAEAEKNYTEALGIYRYLSWSNPEVYASDVAGILHSLAILQYALDRHAEAEANCTEALEIRRHLALSNQESYASDVASTLNDLAIFQYTLRRYAEAEKNYTEALENYRRLALSNPEAYYSYVAITLTNLAGLQSDLGRYAEAEKNYTEALGIFEQSEEKNRGKYADYIQRIKEEINNLKK